MALPRRDEESHAQMVRHEGLRQPREGPAISEPRLARPHPYLNLITLNLNLTTLNLQLSQFVVVTTPLIASHNSRRVAESDDDVLVHRLRKLSAQLDSAKQSAEQAVKEVARAQETSETVRKAVAPLHPSESPLGRLR